MERKEIPQMIAGVKCELGKLGGSELWCVKNNFFEEIGLLQVRNFVGLSKKYDQSYWYLADKITCGRPYILGLNHKLAIHCGSLTYSTCNTLTRKGPKVDLKEIEEKTDKYIDGLTFEEFYDAISNDETLLKEW
jgi:hypothetical protein